MQYTRCCRRFPDASVVPPSRRARFTAGQPQALATVTQLDPIYVDVTQPINRMIELRRALDSGLLQSTGADGAGPPR